MSLDQAYALFNERRKANPLNRGLAAGLQAYENPEIPRRSGIGPIDQAALKSSVQQAIDRTTQQQQLLQDISAKQALGLPTPTGTSAAAYNYLAGRGQYPVNPILAGQPGSALTSPTVSMPYEAATKVGSPTQSETSQAAANAPSKMPATNYGPAGMPKPSLMNQAIGTLGPIALGYNYLLPDPVKNYLASGMSSLGSYLGIGSPAVAGPVADSVVGSAPGWGYSMDAAAPAVTSRSISAAVPAAEYTGPGIGEGVVGATAAEAAAPAAVAEAGGADVLGAVIAAGLGCFITTAATKHGGQDDDGEVLNTLRHFRDTYMRKNKEKSKDVDWYYKNAPRIVSAIDKMPDSDAVYKKMYKQFILPAYHAIKDGQNERAYKIYKSLVNYAESHAGLERGKELTPRYGKDAMADGGMTAFARGGIGDLGDYSDGGRLLKGPGDGVSDSIPATIGGKQPARLADGEFVVPARIVSELGNGSTSAGAKKLYAMMDRIQTGRKKSIGKGKVAVNSRADKYLPA